MCFLLPVLNMFLQNETIFIDNMSLTGDPSFGATGQLVGIKPNPNKGATPSNLVKETNPRHRAEKMLKWIYDDDKDQRRRWVSLPKNPPVQNWGSRHPIEDTRRGSAEEGGDDWSEGKCSHNKSMAAMIINIDSSTAVCSWFIELSC